MSEVDDRPELTDEDFDRLLNLLIDMAWFIGKSRVRKPVRDGEEKPDAPSK